MSPVTNPPDIKARLAELVGRRVRIVHRPTGSGPTVMVGTLAEQDGLPGWYQLVDGMVTYPGGVAVPWHHVEAVEPADEQDGPPRWRLELTPEEVAARRMECARDGHDFEHIVFPVTRDLSGVFCSHCGERWHVVQEAGE